MEKSKKFIALAIAVAIMGTCLAACNKAKGVAAMQIGAMPTKLEYIEGELFDPAGLVLLVQYADGTTAAIDDGYTWDLTDPLEEDDDEVVISYGGKSKIIEIEVDIVKPVSIEIVGNPKTEYEIGERFDATGLAIKATYEDGSSETVTSGFRVSPSTKLTQSVDKVTVTYKRTKVDLPIKVNAARIVEIVVSNPPAKTEYNEGEYFEITGLEIAANYSDGNVQRISDYDYSPKTALTKDVSEIVISYGGMTVKQPIKVKELAVMLAVTSPPTKTLYNVGENFDSAGLVVSIIEHGTSRTLDPSEYDIVGGLDLKLGSTVSVALKSDNTVSARVPISVSKTTDIKKSHCEGACDVVSGRADLCSAAVGEDYLNNFVKDSKITFNVTSAAAGKAELILRTASTYVTEYGTNIYWPVSTGDVQVNKLFKVSVNGVGLSISDDIIIKGSKTDNPTGTVTLLADWKDIVMPNVDLRQGENVIEVVFLEQIYKNADVYEADGTTIKKPGVLSSPCVDTFAVKFTN